MAPASGEAEQVRLRAYSPKVRSPGFRSQLPLPLIWASYFASKYLSVCICEAGIIMAFKRIAARMKLDITDVEHLAQSLGHGKFLMIVS